MKKLLISAVAAATLCASFCVARHSSINNELITPDIQALTDCEVTQGDKVLFSCAGEGKCQKTYMGVTLTCDGKKK